MIHFLKDRVTSTQLREMLEEYEDMVKIVVDIRLSTLAGGGEMHSDCESVLLEHGSEQDDLWGANWFPGEQRIAYESLINIRPSIGNRGILIQDEALRTKVSVIVTNLLGGVH